MQHRVLTRVLTRTALAAVPVAVLAATVLGAAHSASADDAGPNEPIGTVGSVSVPRAGVVEFTGWVADPDDPMRNLTVSGVVDGKVVSRGVTSEARPWQAREYGVSPTSGFTLDVAVKSGNHVVCLVAANVGEGLNRILTCRYTPLGRTPGSSEVASRSPRGAIVWTNAGPGRMHVVGWASDPDYLARRLEIAVYVDGQWAKNGLTAADPDRQHPEDAGINPWFDVIVPVADGAHLACVWAVDIAQGENRSLGCRAADTRGTDTSTVTPPAVNAEVVTEAKKHLGQHYVWGAAGPSTFDCSGLVAYSYGKFGVTTPRVSSDQFRAARLISADRAVAGDLVFYHDSTGDVYHVGIYLEPGSTVAAIDYAHGVDYQHIWDPSTATYGSFTHS